jgi:hypothetical protein
VDTPKKTAASTKKKKTTREIAGVGFAISKAAQF